MQCSTHSFWLSYFKTSNFIIVFFSISVWRVGRVRPSFMYGLQLHLHYNIDLFVQLCHSRSYPTARVTIRAVYSYLCTHCTRVHFQRPQPWIKIISHLQRMSLGMINPISNFFEDPLRSSKWYESGVKRKQTWFPVFFNKKWLRFLAFVGPL